AWVWASWWWGFRDHGFVVMVSCWWFPDTKTHQQLHQDQKHTLARVRFRLVLVFETTYTHGRAFGVGVVVVGFS
ncbi:hypothetical protein W5M_09017, partial [Corynebacterium diphtheriae bv. intermedius str. NCTC 5011]